MVSSIFERVDNSGYSELYKLTTKKGEKFTANCFSLKYVCEDILKRGVNCTKLVQWLGIIRMISGRFMFDQAGEQSPTLTGRLKSKGMTISQLSKMTKHHPKKYQEDF